MSGSLHGLLSRPFGPYMDSDVLTEACKSIPTNVLRLHDLRLECGGKPIGLTQCEQYQPEYDEERVTANGVRFRGVLEIRSLTWLTSKARKRLDKDIRQRDVESRIKNGGRISPSSPTLERIYARDGGLTVKLMIQGQKHMSVVFLATKAVPNGLYLKSEDKDRYYEVISMDATTYTSSRKYLARYRALRMLRDLIKLDAQTVSSTGESPTPLAERTPEWFASLYKEHMAKSASARTRRLVYTSSDSDIEPNTGGRLKAGREHTLPHIPRAKILSLLAAHASWILTDQKQRMRKFLDTEVWEAWVRRSRQASAAAHREGIRWGKWDDLDPNDSDSDACEDEPPPPPRRRAKPKSRQANRPQLLSTASSSRSTTLVTQLPSDDDMTVDAVDQSTLRSYDPDFSPPSTPPASPSSSEASLPSRPSTPPNPEITSLIPPAFYHRPMLPSTDFTWICPVSDCYYEIALLHLTEENCRRLHEQDARRLKAGGWRLRDNWVQRCFARLVSVHYEEHLDRLGIRIRRENRKPMLEWKNPQLHNPWPPRQREPIIQPPDPVKDEEDD